MTAEVKVSATVSADGSKATTELRKLIGNVSDTKVELEKAQRAANAASAELKKLDTVTGQNAQTVEFYKAKLRELRAAEFETAEAAKIATNALNAHNQSLGKVTTSAGQMRAASANLGQQIGDISQGLAMGIEPARLFAQQGGQVAFAMSGMGGAMGKVGAFLSGPWGAVLTGATIILSSLASAHDKAGQGADGQNRADKSLADALKDLDAATGFSNRSTAEKIKLAEADANASLKQAQSDRDAAKAVLDGARARVAAAQADAQVGGGRGANLGGNFVTDTAQSRLALALKQFDELDAKLKQGTADAAASVSFGRAEQAAKALADPLEAIRQRYAAINAQIRDQRLSVPETTAKLAAAYKAEQAALDAVRESGKNASAAQREHNKELRDAERDATKAAEAAERFAKAQADGMEALINKGRDFGRGLVAGNVPARNDGVDQIVEKIENGGGAAGDAFNDRVLTQAVAIGQAIGGSAGKAISLVAGLVQGGRSGNFTGVGGPVGGILTLARNNLSGKAGTDFNEGFGGSIFGKAGQLKIGEQLAPLLKPLRPIGDALSKTFGDGGKVFGKLVGGAATGTAVSGLANAVGIKLNETGAKIGGALGQFAGPLGSLVGSVLGGVVGNLFSKPKTGSATISSSSSSVARSGNNGDAISNAVGLAGQVQTAIDTLAQQLGGSVRDFGKLSVGSINGYYGVNLAGETIGKNNSKGFGNSANAAADAMNYAITVALDRGAIANLSPRVLATLKSYSDNVEKGLAEALKVKGLEDLLSDRKNPFAGTFRTLEQQLRQRVDIATRNGFDLVEIEKVNGEDRAKALKDTLAASTGSIRALLNDLTFGSRATGSPVERLAGLNAERDRLTGLVRGGDNGQLDAIANIVQQIDELQAQTFGKTQGFADGRADSVSLLNDLVKLTEDRIKAAADDARATAQSTVTKLTEANASLDDLVVGVQRTNELLTSIGAGGGGGSALLDVSQFTRF